MVNGTVNANLEPIVQIAVQGLNGVESDQAAIFDTGFNGFITLPQNEIAKLKLRAIGLARITLADGREEFCNVYEANVFWDGMSIPIEVDSAETSCLVGMALLLGFELRVSVIAGGVVSINRLP